ncbi:hypothetical protein LguiA_002252 [Lonicera macranthoides]
MSEVVASLEVALALQEKKDSSLLDEDIFDFCETYDDREVVGSCSLHSDNVYTDSSTTLVPLSHYPTAGPCEAIGKPSLREDTLGGPASETLSNITANMIYDEQINENILHAPTVADRTASFALEGATNPEYIVTADDVDTIIAIECVAMDHKEHLPDSHGGVVPTTLVSEKSRYPFMIYTQQAFQNFRSPATEISKIFCDVTSDTLRGPTSLLGSTPAHMQSMNSDIRNQDDTPGASATEILSKIKGNMTCEEQINDKILVSEVASLFR